MALDPTTSIESTTSKQEANVTVASVSEGNDLRLAQPLKTAQKAIHLPEVQEILRRLSEYGLGIFMPHMHDEETGEFQPLPDEVIQVESGLEVSFHPMEEIANQTHRFLPVGWFWRAGTSAALAVCEMVRERRPDDSERFVKHKMPGGNRV